MNTTSLIDSPQARAMRANDRLAALEERSVRVWRAAHAQRAVAYAYATCYEDKIAADAVFFAATSPIEAEYEAALKEVRG